VPILPVVSVVTILTPPGPRPVATTSSILDTSITNRTISTGYVCVVVRQLACNVPQNRAEARLDCNDCTWS
jgi:hypothetical protein